MKAQVRIALTWASAVALVVYYSNFAELADDLRLCVERLGRAQKSAKPIRASVRSTGKSERAWRVVDRLTPDEQRAVVDAFLAGTTLKTLTKQYGMAHTSIIRLLKSFGASAKDRPRAA